MRPVRLTSEAPVNRQPGGMRAVWIDAGVAVLLIALVWVGLATLPLEIGQAATTPVSYLLAVMIGAPYAVHRRFPVPAVGVSYLALIAYSFGHFSAYPGYAAFALVFGIGLHVGRRLALIAYLAGVVVLTMSLAVQSPEVATLSAWVSTFLALTVAWLAGENLRARRGRRERQRADAERLTREREDRARRAVVEERLRIARDLHDVVAHSMSVIAVQAGVANHVVDQRPEQAREALVTIETLSRQALVEMRRLLGVLRAEPGEGLDLVPAQRLRDLGQLLDQFERAGLHVEVQRDARVDDLPPALDVTAHRIVQEGLTNVLRHGGPVARLTLARTGDKVLIEISDDGRAPSSNPALVGSGHGLTGIQERTALFGGHLEAGSKPEGGFTLRAELPVDAGARTA